MTSFAALRLGLFHPDGNEEQYSRQVQCYSLLGPKSTCLQEEQFSHTESLQKLIPGQYLFEFYQAKSLLSRLGVAIFHTVTYTYCQIG